MKKLFTLVFICLVLNVFGQGNQPDPSPLAASSLDVSNINPKILTGGDAFWDLYGQGFEVPRGSGKHTIFAGALWLGGKDQNNNLYVAAQTYRQGGGTPPIFDSGYWPGPVAVVQDSAFSKKYDKIWKVNKADIKKHIADFHKPGYVIPAGIATWPGNGNITNSEAANLAPFIDLNNNGIYEPSHGDYPEIKGDQALYLILNDRGNTKEPFSPPINAEVHIMYFGFNHKTNPAAFNTLFAQYRIINRGQHHLTNFYAGLWTDLEIGKYNDDYVGCDTLTNRYYGYNGDNDDEGPTGYGLNPPTQSVIFLDKKMSHFLYYNNDRNPINGNPTKSADFYNYLSGFWKNGSPVTHGGDGTNPNRPPFPYMFPGDPLTLTGWSEANTLTFPAANIPSDRRGLGSMGPFTFAPSQELNFTVAYTFSPGTATVNSLTQAQLDAQAIHQFFASNYYVEEVEEPEEPLKLQPNLTLYPNPASEKLTIHLPSDYHKEATNLQITDYLGRIILTSKVLPDKPELVLNIRELPKGIYQVTVTSGNQHSTARFVKQ